MQKEKKIYVGSGKKQSETWMKVNLNSDELSKYAEEYMGKKYIKLNINITEPDKYGKTVSVTVDTWKPDASKAAPAASFNNRPAQVPDTDNLPF
jgi:hypothetical protein